MIGRDLPARQRQRDGFRRRIPRTLPKILEPRDLQKLIAATGSYRDKAILILLLGAGPRIGDWSPVAGRHGGFWGNATGGYRSQAALHHCAAEGCRVTSTAFPSPTDFWPIYEEYLRTERLRGARMLWPFGSTSRKGRGKPLRYASFESP